MSKEDFLETCVVLSGLDRESILKTVLKEKFNNVTTDSEKDTENSTALPTGLDLLVHTPSRENFAEYAFGLCSLPDSKEAITRHLLSILFDAAVESEVRPRVRTRQSKQRSAEQQATLKVCGQAKKRKKTSSANSSTSSEESSTETESAAQALCNIQKKTEQERKLPSKLNVFLRNDGKTPMVAMSEIVHGFFPGLTLLWPGIYMQTKQEYFVLLVVDNGRYSNSWKSAGTQNKLTWFTSTEDVGREVFDKITANTSVVHVVRKRNSEMRYMGKSQRTEHINKDEGSCVMYVA